MLIDTDFLSRQTWADRGLQRELLELFVAQSQVFLAGVASGPRTAGLAHRLHTLKGAARAIGAWTVGNDAERIEANLAIEPAGDSTDGLGLQDLRTSLDATCCLARRLIETS